MKQLAKFAVPLIISQLVAQLMVLSDIWMMARIGVITMAAGGLAGSVFSFIFIVVMFFSQDSRASRGAGQDSLRADAG